MCGIAGAIGYIDEKIINCVAQINSSMEHRGPDGDGIWVNEQDGVVLAHRRLAIIDLSTEALQPMKDDLTGNMVVFNGEIYNFKAIKDELIQLGAQFHTSSDTEVILVAYRQWGEGFVDRLRGMFSIVIWDHEKKKAFVVRDRLGIKPLYYTEIKYKNQTTLIFSSEIRSLISSGLVDKKINPDAVESMVWNGFVSGNFTIVDNIFSLQAGHYLTADKHNVSTPKEYWRLPKRNKNSGGDSTLKLREVLLESVNLHLISDVPVGVFLSGGIDSSALAALASQQNDSQISTFNIAFEDDRFDESKYARAVAKSLSTDHHEIQLTQKTFTDSLTDAMKSIDHPSFDGVNTYFVSRAVREAGIKVALAGTGGDELFGGYRTFVDLPKVMSFSRMFKFLPDGALAKIGQSLSTVINGKQGLVPPQVRWGKIKDILLTNGGCFEAYQTNYAMFTREFHQQLLGSSTTTLDYGTEASFAQYTRELVDGQSTLETISDLELSFFIGQRLLRDTDSASMASSLEVRVPLLDHIVVEQCAELNIKDRYYPLRSKQLLKDLAMPGLDDSLFDRPKSGFVLPFDVWCRDTLKDDIEKTLHDKDLCESVGLQYQKVRDLYQAFQMKSPGIYWSRVWGIYCLLWWCKQYEVYL